MRGRRIELSRPRRFLTDLLHLAVRVPTVPVQRQMSIGPVVAARAAADGRPCWPAVFLKAYALVADELPVLRRAYLTLPWCHVREYPTTIASLAVEREYGGESCVFFGRISDPAGLPLAAIHAHVRTFAEAPVESIRAFRKLLAVAGLPGPLRRAALWLGLNLPRTRPGQFGTFGLSSYASLGAESLHPLSPLTTTLSYGVIGDDGRVVVRLVYDHRVLDGATAARVLKRLDDVLAGPILAELRRLANAPRLAA